VGDGRWCSEAVTPDVVARFSTIPGYQLAPADLDVAAVDAAIAARPVGEVPSDVAAYQRTIGELERANQAMAADLAHERQQRLDAERKLAKSEVPRLEAEIERLRRQIDEPSSLLTTLQGENTTLKAENERLGAEVTRLRAATAPAPARAPAGMPPRRTAAPQAPPPA
jgi:septal ring factor EnvC (AmiA/AmiB activator)